MDENTVSPVDETAQPGATAPVEEPEATESTRETPVLKLVGGTRKPYGLTEAAYDAATQVYAQHKTVNAVVKAIRVSRATARRLVNEGSPRQGWQPIKKRVAEMEAQVKGEQLSAVKKTMAARYDTRVQALDQRQKVLLVAKAGFVHLLEQWRQDCQRASFDRGTKQKIIKIRDASGNIVDQAVSTTDGGALAMAGQRLMQGWEIFAKEERCDSAAEAKELQAIALPPGLKDLPTEDLDYIVRTGQLPPHVSEDQIYGRTEAGTGS